MSREPFVLGSDVTVAEATRLVLQRGLHGSIVVDEESRPIGVVSVVDLARALLEPDGASRLLRGVATIPALTVSPDDGVYEAIDKMVRNNVHRLAVVRLDGTLVGVVSPTDVLRGIVNLEGAFHATPRPPPHSRI